MIHTYVETRKVGNNDGLIRVDNKYYKVPQHLVGMKVQIQIDETVISVLQGGVVVATLDKTADVFNPQAQDLSNGEIEKETFNKSMDKLAEDLSGRPTVSTAARSVPIRVPMTTASAGSSPRRKSNES